MTTTSEKILQKIKESQIAPEPKWHFLLKNRLLWFVFFVALIVGALSFSVILEMLVYHDWDIYKYLHKSFLQYVMISLPYIWIFSLALMSIIVYYDYTHTKGWYRHRAYRVVLASMGLSIALGTGAFYLGVGEKIDQTLSKNISQYELMKLNKQELWVHPEDGLLGGDVAEIKAADDFVLQDHSGRQWEVKIAPTVTNTAIVRVGERVKIIGKEKDERNFEADEIRDWDSKKIHKNDDEEKNKNKGGVCLDNHDDCDEGDE